MLAVCSLFSAQEEDVEVLAKYVEKEGTKVYARGDVVLYSSKYVVTADEVDYDYESGDAELRGNITILEGVDYSIRSGKAKLNFRNDEGEFSPLFFFDERSNVWMKCEDSVSDPGYYLAKKSIVSSCNVQDPDWKISFTSGEFNRNSKFLHLYNPVFYANDIPVFYLPYFGFSTDRSRRSGLLRPDMGLGSSEGLYYLQPIYFAMYKNWDLELDPQIRSKRGVGLYSTFRFADSPYSKGAISIGRFAEKETYALDNQLKNDTHYGFEIRYERSKLLSEKNPLIEDGLLVDVNYLNDIDYYNTLRSDKTDYNQLVTSTINYYAKTDMDYVGLYAKYYIDTSKISNDDTLQELPTAHYHRFSDSFISDKLLYSVDYKVKNFDRQEGLTAVQNEVNIPISFFFSAFDDYLHFSVSENVYMTHVSYDNQGNAGKYGQYLRNFHQFSMFADLAKPYENFFHTMYLGVDYILPSAEKKEGRFEDFVEPETQEESVNLKLVQYFYDSAGKKRASHSLKQPYYFSDTRYKYGDLENKLKLHITDTFSITQNTNFSHERSEISKNQTALSYEDDIYKLSFMYTYEYKEPAKNNDFITFFASTKYYKNYTLFTSADYDIEDNQYKSWSVGWQKKQKCWDYSLIYKNENTPKLTSTGSDSVNKNGVYLMFNLYPMGKIGYGFSKKSSTADDGLQ